MFLLFFGLFSQIKILVEGINGRTSTKYLRCNECQLMTVFFQYPEQSDIQYDSNIAEITLA